MKQRSSRLILLFAWNAILWTGFLHGIEALWAFRDPSRGLPFDGFKDGIFYTWGHPVRRGRLEFKGRRFRSRDFDLPKPSGTYRVMALGDSFTFGRGLAEEERYTERVEALLRAAFPRRKIEVINFGIQGADTGGERDILNTLGPQVDPDRVLVGFCNNDPKPGGADRSQKRDAFNTRHGGWMNFVKQRLEWAGLPMVAGRVHSWIYTVAERTGTIPTGNEEFSRVYNPESPEWKRFTRALADIVEWSRRRKLPPPIFAVLTVVPHSFDLTHPDENLRLALAWEEQARRAAETAGFITVGFLKEIAAAPPGESLHVNAADGHPGARLNDIYARGLFDLLRKEMTDGR
jgi:lysophospholipase L1-like esterase